MKREREEQLAALVRRAALERDMLAAQLLELGEEVARRKSQWKLASLVATGLATAATVGYRLFGKSSLSAQVGRAASAASILFRVARAALRIRRSW